MTMSPHTRSVAAPPPYPHTAAFSIQISRNWIVQALGLTMVSLTGLAVVPWSWLAGWAVVAIAAAMTENRLLRRMAEDPDFARRVRGFPPVLRTIVTSIYAIAALALITMGDEVERLFAFALISASMINVLMRYYRSPTILTPPASVNFTALSARL